MVYDCLPLPSSPLSVDVLPAREELEPEPISDEMLQSQRADRAHAAPPGQ